MKREICFFIFLFIITQTVLAAERPKDFVDLSQIDPAIEIDMRYYSDHNFVGTRIDGYEAPVCLLTKKAADALANAESELKPFNLSLKVYDCYRPQRAVDHFDRWALNTSDTKMKAEFYPHEDKANVFKDGYIAHKSGHSRGSTVDLAIVSLPLTKQEGYSAGSKLKSCIGPANRRFRDNSLDFGSGFDCFDAVSHTENLSIPAPSRALRLLLKGLMEKNGFKPYSKEWWHFTLKDEPYPDTYFDFPVR